MADSPTRVTLTEPGLAGDYIVAKRHPDGTLGLAPDTSVEVIRRRLGTNPMTSDEFGAHFGHLLVDDEG